MSVSLLFYFFIAMAAFSAVGILFSRNVFKSALYLLVTLISIAALYALTYAEFLAVAQILIYAGGIAVIIIFGVMLTTRMTGHPLVVQNAHILSGGIVSISLFILLVRYLPGLSITTRSVEPENINVIALRIFSKHSLPFEVAGLLLTVALVGAAVTTAHLRSKV